MTPVADVTEALFNFGSGLIYLLFCILDAICLGRNNTFKYKIYSSHEIDLWLMKGSFCVYIWSIDQPIPCLAMTFVVC